MLAGLGGQVGLAQFVHELCLHLGAAVGQQLGAHPQLRRGGAVPDSPGAELGQYRDELDRGFGEAVGGPLSAAGVVAGEQPGVGEPSEAVGEDVGGGCSSEPASSSRKWRRLPNITSRSTSRLQRSPKASTAMLIGNLERGGSRIVLLLAWKLVAVTIAMARLPVVKCNRMTG